MASTAVLNIPLRILVLGATGYIGGSILDRLIQHPGRHSYEIISYSRNEEKAKILQEKFEVKSIIGTLDDSQKIEDAATTADIVIHTANSADHIGSAQAILRGLKKRYERDGQVPIYIHCSGTGVIADDAKGMHGDHIVYDDTNIEQLRSIPESAFHRNVDLTLLAADAEGYVCTYIVFPSTIYGIATGPIFDAKVANPHSIQVPELIKASIDRGRAGIIGEGNNVWPHVHIDDIADLFLVLFNTIVQEPERVGHGWEGFYFGENGNYKYSTLGEKIGEALVNTGKATEVSPTPFTKEEVDKYFAGSEYLGSNSLCISKRGRALGWEPKFTTENFYKSILPETKAILESYKLGTARKVEIGWR